MVTRFSLSIYNCQLVIILHATYAHAVVPFARCEARIRTSEPELAIGRIERINDVARPEVGVTKQVVVFACLGIIVPARCHAEA